VAVPETGCPGDRTAERAKLTELTKEQASYLGVAVEGPCGPDHYRYWFTRPGSPVRAPSVLRTGPDLRDQAVAATDPACHTYYDMA
jgi:hypothetical protein